MTDSVLTSFQTSMVAASSQHHFDTLTLYVGICALCFVLGFVLAAKR